MPNIYFNELTGNSITGDGSSSAPYKYLRQAELQASASDTIINQATAYTGIDGSLTMNYQGGVFDGAINLKNGEVWRHNEEDWWFQADSTSWVENAWAYGSGQGHLVGVDAAYNSGVSLGRMRGNIAVPKNSRVRLRYIIKTESGGVAYVNVRDMTTGGNPYYNYVTGSWISGTTGTNYNIPDTAGVWVEGVTGWVEPVDLTSTDGLNIQFDVISAAGKKGWIQYLGYELEAVWQQHSGDVYKCPVACSQTYEETFTMWVGADRELRHKCANLASISAGRFWFERGLAAAGDNKSQLFYQLKAGETTAIFDSPIYAQRRKTFLDDTGANSLSDMTITGFSDAVITSTGTTVTKNVTCDKNYLFNFRVTGSGTQTNTSSYASNSQGNQAPEPVAVGGGDHPKGYFVSGSGSMTCTGANAHNIYDDNFQTTDGNLTITGFYCTGSTNGSGISHHGAVAATGNLIATNGTIVHGHDIVGGIRDQNSSAAGNKLTLSGVVVVCINGATNAMEHGRGAVPIDLTDSSDNNYYNGTADAAYAAYATDVTNLAGFGFESGTYVPASGSVLQGTGSKWWTGANPVGADGEPYSDWDTDLGGMQSKSSPFHPSNLP